jgi:hypothetical protein
LSKSPKVRWAEAPAAHDYPAAANYLRLLASASQADALAASLEQAPTSLQYAKDLLRAARLPLLAADDPDVAKELKRVGRGVALSPVLLVRGTLATGVPLQIADGYHRVCASYHLNEDTDIPCRLVESPAPVARRGPRSSA